MSTPTARVPVRHTDAAQRQGLELRSLRLTEAERREDARRFLQSLSDDGYLAQDVLDDLTIVTCRVQCAREARHA